MNHDNLVPWSLADVAMTAALCLACVVLPPIAEQDQLRARLAVLDEESSEARRQLSLARTQLDEHQANQRQSAAALAGGEEERKALRAQLEDLRTQATRRDTELQQIGRAHV